MNIKRSTLLFLILTPIYALHAQVPQSISFQGVLTDTEGALVSDGVYELTLSLYEAEGGGTAIWSEKQEVDVSRGIFSMLMGAEEPLGVRFDRPYWLGIAIDGGDELQPRTPLSASPYSLGARMTIAEPEAGSSLALRDSAGTRAHLFSADGSSSHSRGATFGSGVEIAEDDTSQVGLFVAVGEPVDETFEKRSRQNGGFGIVGTSESGIGVKGLSGSNHGVRGISGKSVGVSGDGKTIGVEGFGEEQGVLGRSLDGPGVVGKSGFKEGVVGQAISEAGVRGTSSSGSGVFGESSDGNGVTGKTSGNQVGVRGEATGEGVGVAGVAVSGAGVLGSSISGFAGRFLGDVEVLKKLKLGAADEDPSNEKFLVWGADNWVKWRTLPESIGDGEDDDWISIGENSIATDKNISVRDGSGNTVFEVKTNGTSVHAGRETFKDGIDILDRNGKTVISLGEGGLTFTGFNGETIVLSGIGLDMADKDHNLVFATRFDGTSFHKGEEIFEGGITLRGDASAITFSDGSTQTTASAGGTFGGTLENKPLVVKDANGNEVFRVDTDGTSLHKGKETFADGIEVLGAQGQTFFIADGQGVRVVDGEGLNVGGIGLSDTFGGATGVYGRASGEDGLAGSFRGDVEVHEGELRVHNGEGDVVFRVREDGTSVHAGEEEFVGGLKAPLTNGNILRVNPDDGYSIKTADGEFITHNDPNGNAFFSGFMSTGGDVWVGGTLSKQSGSFKIDHPLDPENKYLYHSFVESPDMMNVYNGNVVLDAEGEAWIELPEWFEALNRDFRYQLTCIGGFAGVYVASEIAGNRFKIGGGFENLKVSWQVTGIRHDRFADENRVPVEVPKPPNERGALLYQPAESP